MYRSNQGSSSGGPEDNPCLTLYNDFVNSTPAVTRLSIMGLIFTWIFSWFFDLDGILGNITYFTYFDCEVYRILLSPLVGNSFIAIIMLMFFYPMMGTRMEYGLGSAGFLCLLVMLGLIINIIFNMLCFMLYLIGIKHALLFNCSGFFNVIFAILTIECQRNPEAPRLILCCPFPIASKYFPFVFFLLFTILSGPQLDLAVGIIVGIWYANGSLDCMNPSNSSLGQLESGWFHSLTELSLWIPTSAAMGYQAYEPTAYYDSGGGAGMYGMFSSSSSSSSESSAPQFPGYGNVTGYSSSSQAVPVAEAFPGSGNRIGSAVTSTYPTATAVSSLPQLGVVSSPSLPAVSSSNSGGSSSANKPTREELAAKRLAALSKGASGSQGGSGDSNV